MLQSAYSPSTVGSTLAGNCRAGIVNKTGVKSLTRRLRPSNSRTVGGCVRCYRRITRKRIDRNPGKIRPPPIRGFERSNRPKHPPIAPLGQPVAGAVFEARAVIGTTRPVSASQRSSASRINLRLCFKLASLDLKGVLENFGIATLASTAIRIMTNSNSTKVKPNCL